MTSQRMFLVPIAALAALTVSACAAEPSGDSSGGAEASESGSDNSQSARLGQDVAISETGWLTVGSDGAVQTTFFDAGGRYRDLRNGALLAQGMWEQRPDGTVCFEPDAGLGACWETGSEDETGTVIATNGDGKRIEIKRVTYLAPPAPEADEAVEEGADSGAASE